MPQKKQSIHYVNNADFSQAVVDYVTTVNEAKQKSTTIPKVPNYVAQCFLRKPKVYHTRLTLFVTLIVKKWLWMQ